MAQTPGTTEHFIQNATLPTLRNAIWVILNANTTGESRPLVIQFINTKKRELQNDFQRLQEEIDWVIQSLKDKSERVTVDELGNLMAEYLDLISKMQVQARPLQEFKSMWNTLMRLVEHVVDVEQEELEGHGKELDKFHRRINAVMLQVCKEEGMLKPENLREQKKELRNLIRKFQGMEGSMLQRYKETMIYLLGFGDWKKMDGQYSG